MVIGEMENKDISARIVANTNSITSCTQKDNNIVKSNCSKLRSTKIVQQKKRLK